MSAKYLDPFDYRDIKPLNYKGKIQFNNDLDEILENTENTSIDWKIRELALKKIGSISLGNFGKSDIFIKLFNKKLCLNLDTQLGDLRSSVMKEACRIVSLCAKQLGLLIETGIVQMFTQYVLFKIAGSANRVIADSTSKCILNIVQYVHSIKIIINVCQQKLLKANAVRVLCAQCLVNIMNFYQSKYIEKTKDILEETMKTLISDANAEVRATTRRAFILYRARFPLEGEELFEELGKNVQKQINEDEKIFKFTINENIDNEEEEFIKPKTPDVYSLCKPRSREINFKQTDEFSKSSNKSQNNESKGENGNDNINNNEDDNDNENINDEENDNNEYENDSENNCDNENDDENEIENDNENGNETEGENDNNEEENEEDEENNNNIKVKSTKEVCKLVNTKKNLGHASVEEPTRDMVNFNCTSSANKLLLNKINKKKKDINECNKNNFGMNYDKYYNFDAQKKESNKTNIKKTKNILSSSSKVKKYSTTNNATNSNFDNYSQNSSNTKGKMSLSTNYSNQSQSRTNKEILQKLNAKFDKMNLISENKSNSNFDNNNEKKEKEINKNNEAKKNNSNNFNILSNINKCTNQNQNIYSKAILSKPSGSNNPKNIYEKNYPINNNKEEVNSHFSYISHNYSNGNNNNNNSINNNNNYNNINNNINNISNNNNFYNNNLNQNQRAEVYKSTNISSNNSTLTSNNNSSRMENNSFFREPIEAKILLLINKLDNIINQREKLLIFQYLFNDFNEILRDVNVNNISQNTLKKYIDIHIENLRENDKLLIEQVIKNLMRMIFYMNQIFNVYDIESILKILLFSINNHNDKTLVKLSNELLEIIRKKVDNEELFKTVYGLLREPECDYENCYEFMSLLIPQCDNIFTNNNYFKQIFRLICLTDTNSIKVGKIIDILYRKYKDSFIQAYKEESSENKKKILLFMENSNSFFFRELKDGCEEKGPKDSLRKKEIDINQIIRETIPTKNNNNNNYSKNSDIFKSKNNNNILDNNYQNNNNIINGKNNLENLCLINLNDNNSSPKDNTKNDNKTNGGTTVYNKEIPLEIKTSIETGDMDLFLEFMDNHRSYIPDFILLISNKNYSNTNTIIILLSFTRTLIYSNNHVIDLNPCVQLMVKQLIYLLLTNSQNQEIVDLIKDILNKIPLSLNPDKFFNAILKYLTLETDNFILETLLLCIKNFVMNTNSVVLLNLLNYFIANIFNLLNHKVSEIRKHAVYCCVEIYMIIGKKFDPYLKKIPKTQQNLIRLFIKKRTG